MALCKTAVFKLYQELIDDVINGSREMFVEEGVDEQILQELKQIWHDKLKATKAVENPSDAVDNKTLVKKQELTSNGINGSKQQQQQQQVVKQPTVVGHVAPNNHVQTAVLDGTKMVPLQITIPAQPGAADSQQRVLTIQVPASALQGNQLHNVLTGPIITATMGLPQAIASTLLQQHVNAAFQSQQQGTINTIVAKPLSQVDGCADADLFETFMNMVDSCSDTLSCADRQLLKNIQYTNEATLLQNITDSGFPCQKSNSSVEIEISIMDVSQGSCSSSNIVMKPSSKKRQRVACSKSTVTSKEDAILLKKLRLLHQTDGPEDTSDEEEDGSDDDEDDDEPDDDKDEEDQELDEGGPEEEPLNSEDDVTDEDPSDLFDTDNVVVCQYDKITRSRNKWKFYLKDGIMNLEGEDLIFQKANGDAEW